MRRAAKTDTAHAAIRDGLRKLGYSVFDTSRLGAGFTDLVVGCHGRTYLVEVKTPRGKNTRQTAQERLGAAQIAFRSQWKGGPVIVAYDLETVLYDIKCDLLKTGYIR